MIRTYKKWWLLRFLSWDCSRHVADQNTQDIKNGLQLGVDKAAFLDTLSKLVPSNQKLTSRELNVKLAEYHSIISSCIHDGYIDLIPTPNKLSGFAIRVSYLGDDFTSWGGLINLLWQKMKGVGALIAWFTTIAITIITTYIATKSN
ncbi:MAG: hypothetical protein ABSE68_01260 [Minisyncoccia bacterium]